MCCFSHAVEWVSSTKIFARGSKDGRQFLAYEMQYKAAEDLSMILPIPVPAASKDDAVRFINLKDYGDFFADLAEMVVPEADGAEALRLADADLESHAEADFVRPSVPFCRGLDGGDVTADLVWCIAPEEVDVCVLGADVDRRG